MLTESIKVLRCISFHCYYFPTNVSISASPLLSGKMCPFPLPSLTHPSTLIILSPSNLTLAITCSFFIHFTFLPWLLHTRACKRTYVHTLFLSIASLQHVMPQDMAHGCLSPSLLNTLKEWTPCCFHPSPHL